MNNLDLTTLKPINYNRKSSEAEDRQVLSISSQVSEAKRVADFYGLPGFVEVLEESKSAKTEFKRPKFDEMMSMIEKGKADSIVCWKLDRLARNMTEGGKIIDLLSSGVIKAIITNDKIFYPWDNVIVMSVEFSQGKQFVKDLSVNVKRGQTTKATKGYPHGVASIGFKNDKTEEKGNRKWMEDELRFPLVKQMFEMYLSGAHSVSEIHRIAKDDMKLRTPLRKKLGDKPLSISYVYTLFKNPIYAGFFYYGNKRYELNKSLKRMITEDQYWKIQDMLGKKGNPRPQKREALYNSFMNEEDGGSICADHKFQVICDCKKKFSYLNRDSCPSCGVQIEEMIKPTYLRYTYYTPVKAKKDKTRKAYCIEEKKIDDYLISYLEENLEMSKELCDWCIKYLHELRDKELEDQKSYLNNLANQREIVEKELRELIRMKVKGQLDDEEYQVMKKELEDKKVGCNQEVSKDWFSEVSGSLNLSAEIIDVLKNGTLKEKKTCLHQLGSNLVMNEKKLNIINKKEIQIFIDGLNKAKAKNKRFEPKNIVDLSTSNKVFEDVRPIMLRRQDSNLQPID